MGGNTHIRFEKTTCPRCGRKIQTGKIADRHVDTCSSLPLATELALILEGDEMLTITKLGQSLGVKAGRLIDILTNGNSGWDKDRIRDRGKEVRRTRLTGGKHSEEKIDYVRGRYQCAGNCGLLVEKEGFYCRFCVLGANGIRDMNDVRFRELSEPVARILRSDETGCFESLTIYQEV